MPNLVASNSRLQVDKNASVSVCFDDTEASITFAARDLKKNLHHTMNSRNIKTA